MRYIIEKYSDMHSDKQYTFWCYYTNQKQLLIKNKFILILNQSIFRYSNLYKMAKVFNPCICKSNRTMSELLIYWEFVFVNGESDLVLI